MPRFTLDEDAAAALIAAVIAYHEDPDAHPFDNEFSPEMPWIGDGTYTVESEAIHTGSDTTMLVEAMLNAGIIADAEHPACPALSFNFEPFDGTRSGYRWTLYLGDGIGLDVNDGFNDFLNLGQDSELKGADLAMAVLREAVAAGNRIVDALDRYKARDIATP